MIGPWALHDFSRHERPTSTRRLQSWQAGPPAAGSPKRTGGGRRGRAGTRHGGAAARGAGMEPRRHFDGYGYGGGGTSLQARARRRIASHGWLAWHGGHGWRTDNPYLGRSYLCISPRRPIGSRCRVPWIHPPGWPWVDGFRVDFCAGRRLSRLCASGRWPSCASPRTGGSVQHGAACMRLTLPDACSACSNASRAPAPGGRRQEAEPQRHIRATRRVTRSRLGDLHLRRTARAFAQIRRTPARKQQVRQPRAQRPTPSAQWSRRPSPIALRHAPCVAFRRRDSSTSRLSRLNRIGHGRTADLAEAHASPIYRAADPSSVPRCRQW